VVTAARHHGDLRGKWCKTVLVMRELYPSKEALDAAGTGRQI